LLELVHLLKFYLSCFRDSHLKLSSSQYAHFLKHKNRKSFVVRTVLRGSFLNRFQSLVYICIHTYVHIIVVNSF
jgi:hypothetical protein